MSQRRSSSRIQNLGSAVPPAAAAAPRRAAAAASGRRAAAAAPRPSAPAAAVRRAAAATGRRAAARRSAAAAAPQGAAASGRRAAAASAAVGQLASGGQRLGRRLRTTSRFRNMATRRLKRELDIMLANPTDGCQVKKVGNGITHWQATILGPTGSPYEGGQFELDLRFPRKYPFGPPKVVFITKIYHCNVSVDGSISINDILKEKWSPAMQVEKLLLLIMLLLSDASPDDAMDHEMANLYKNNREQYDQNARNWTTSYAMPETCRDLQRLESS